MRVLDLTGLNEQQRFETLLAAGLPPEAADAVVATGKNHIGLHGFGEESNQKQMARVLVEVGEELLNAREKHPREFNSAHEGYGIITEEFIELQKEIFLKHKNWDAIRKEAIQLAAMAVRLILDVVDKPRSTPAVPEEFSPCVGSACHLPQRALPNPKPAPSNGYYGANGYGGNGYADGGANGYGGNGYADGGANGSGY